MVSFHNLALVDDVVLTGIEEGLCLLWSPMVRLWCMRMMLGAAAVNEEWSRTPLRSAPGGIVVLRFFWSFAFMYV